MINSELKAIRMMAETVTTNGGWKLEAYINGRWSLIMFGLTYERATEFSMYYAKTRITK